MGTEGSGVCVGTSGKFEAVGVAGKKFEVGTNGNRRRGPFPKLDALCRLVMRAAAGGVLAGVLCGGAGVGNVGKIGGLGGGGIDVAVRSRIVNRVALVR